MRPGKFIHRLSFQKRVETANDGLGNQLTEFQEQFQTRARKHYLRGSNAVLSAKLEGRQPVLVQVRKSCRTEEVTADWRAVDVRTKEIFNIRSIEPEENRQEISFIVERGVADG